MKRIVSIAAVALLMSVADLAGQSPAVAGMQPGTRVRVTSADPDRRFAGNVVFADADSVVLANDYGRAVVPTASIRQVEVSDGRSWIRGGLRGAATGALAMGAVFGGIVLLDGGDAGWTGVGVGVGAALGAPIGFFVGSISGGERWEHRFPVATPASNVALGLRIPLG